jgi:aspartate/methionine/tyrosine aminotransferase
VPLRLHNDKFHLDFDELKNKFSNKTKAIVINTPHNPTGKIFSLEELKKIS